MQLSDLVKLVDENTINTSTAKSLIPKIHETGLSPGELVVKEGLAQISDSSELETIIQKLISDNPDNVERYKGGKTNLIGWFVGQVMRQTQGKADPEIVKQLLEKHLS